MTTLLLFCGSRTGSDPAHAVTARAFGTWCAQTGIRLVYGGGGIGLMGGRRAPASPAAAR